MTTATAPSTKTIHELRNYDGPLYIANTTLNRITCHELVGSDWVNFELDPQGEPDSVMMMPKLALEVRGIQKLWLRGDIVVSTDPAMEDTIALLLNQSVRAPQARLDEIMARGEGEKPQVAEPHSSKALETRACLECGYTNPTTGVVERGQVIQSARDVKDGVAPLCPAHTSLSLHYSPRLVVNEDGSTRWEFDKLSVTDTVRGEM